LQDLRSSLNSRNTIGTAVPVRVSVVEGGVGRNVEVPRFA
jgi:hypothetical protein